MQSHIVLCPNKYRPFERFMRLDSVQSAQNLTPEEFFRAAAKSST